MRRIILFLCLVSLVCTLYSPAFAQDLTGKFSLSPYAGFAFPMGDFADDDWESNQDSFYRKMGFQLGASFDYFFSPYFGGGFHFKYVSYSSKDYDVLEDPKQDDKMSIKMIGVHGKILFIPEGAVRPYCKLGFGMVMSSVSDFPAVDWDENVFYITDLEVDNKLYIQFGAGLAVFVSPKISLFGELTLSNMRVDGAKIELVDLEGAPTPEFETNFNAVDLVAGVNIWFGGTE